MQLQSTMEYAGRAASESPYKEVYLLIGTSIPPGSHTLHYTTQSNLNRSVVTTPHDVSVYVDIFLQ